MKKGHFLFGAIIGGAVASITTALTTPKKGEELRSDIKNEADKFYSDAKIKYSDLSEIAIQKYKEEKKTIVNSYQKESYKYKEEIAKLNDKFFNKNIKEENNKEEK